MWPGHCVASLHSGVQMGTGEFNAGGNSAIDLHPIQEGGGGGGGGESRNIPRIG